MEEAALGCVTDTNSGINITAWEEVVLAIQDLFAFKSSASYVGCAPSYFDVAFTIFMRSSFNLFISPRVSAV
jgi:hypothetical protein